MSSNSFSVLLVEDNKHDVRAIERAWRINNIPNALVVVPNGRICLDLLLHTGEYGNNQTALNPAIILMDIRMPIMDGLECLQHIKSNPSLKTIPVIMLTTSKEDEDRIKSYQLGCNTYIQKPVEFEKLVEVVRQIYLYWTLSELP